MIEPRSTPHLHLAQVQVERKDLKNLVSFAFFAVQKNFYEPR
jgi:hypothetical protein